MDHRCAPLIVTWATEPGGKGVYPTRRVAPPLGVPPDLEPWFHPDPDPGDGPGGLGWACLPAGGRYWVGHFPGPFEPGRETDEAWVRVAGWALDCCDETFDPGACLGDPRSFPPDPTATQVAGEAPLAPSPLGEDRRALVKQLLAHLLEGMVLGYPVLLAVSRAQLVQVPVLQALVAALGQARAALPARLRRRCRLRIPSLVPEPFLGADRADLLAIPTEVAGRALAASRGAVILDRRGGRQVAGAPDPTAVAYASAVTETAARFPQGLTAFGERFDRLWDGAWPLAPALLTLIPTVFDLGVALHGNPQQRANLFANALIDRARSTELPWARLVSDPEWLTFPQDRLTAYLLRPRLGLTPGEMALHGAIERAYRAGARCIDPGVRPWWDAEDGAKRARLLELGQGEPLLVSPALVADLCADIDLAALAADGPLAGVLAAELEAGTLGRREAEAAAIANQAADPGVFQVLREAARRGVLGPAWLDALVGLGDARRLGQVLLDLIAHPEDIVLWGEAPGRLIAALHRAPPSDRTWVDALARGTGGLDPAANLDLYLGLLDLVGAGEPQPGALSTPLLERLWPALDRSDPAARRHIVADLLGGRWTCLCPRDLLNAQGVLRSAWLHTLPDLVLASAGLTAAMALAELIQMRTTREADATSWARAVTARWERDPANVTDALVAASRWYDWRRRADLSLGQRHRAALLWLAAPAWVHHRGAGPKGLPPHWHRHDGRDPHRRPPECTWEAWRRAMADLASGLTAQEMESISAPQTHWPWVFPWEEEQIADLRAICDERSPRNLSDSG